MAKTPVEEPTVELDALAGVDEEDDGAADDEAVARLDAFSGEGVDAPRTPLGVAPGWETIETGATLLDLKLSAASNGANYDVTFEVGQDGFLALARAFALGKGGYSASWQKLYIGEGAEVRRLTGSRDADGGGRFRFNLHLPQSEISRSVGRLSQLLKQGGKLRLEPMQGHLSLGDGTQVDLTTRAE